MSARGGIPGRRDDPAGLRPPHPADQATGLSEAALAPGECAQVDWGAYGTVAVGNTRRRLSFFVMVLAFSRQMSVEITVSQNMEHFLATHEHAFTAHGGVPPKIMVDNLQIGGSAAWPAPHRYSIRAIWISPVTTALPIEPCNVARGNEKGRVEVRCGLRQKEFPAWARADRLPVPSTPPHRSGSIPSQTSASMAKRDGARSICWRRSGRIWGRSTRVHTTSRTLQPASPPASSASPWTPISIPYPPHTLTAV